MADWKETVFWVCQSIRQARRHDIQDCLMERHFNSVYYEHGNFIGVAGKLLRKQFFESSLFDNFNETLLGLIAANDNSAWLKLAA